MCWWRNFSKFICSEEHCRNKSAMFFQLYKLISNHMLLSIKSKTKVPIPHTIDHDERCDFVAILAIIIGEPPEEKFENCFLMADALKYYVADKADLDDGNIIAKSICISLMVKKEGKEYTIDKDIVTRIHVYEAAVVASIKLYLEQGPIGSFGPQYLLEVLK